LNFLNFEFLLLGIVGPVAKIKKTTTKFTLMLLASIYGAIHRHQQLATQAHGKLLGRAWRILNSGKSKKRKENKVNDAVTQVIATDQAN
jgi:hypothetical protein